MARHRTLLALVLGLLVVSRVRPVCADEPAERAPHREWGLLPALGYDPDTGFDVGAFLHIAQIDPDLLPYAWQVRAQAQVSLLTESGLEIPKYDHYVRLDLPQWPGDGGRLRLDLTWKHQLNAGYFGLGNASVATIPAGASSQYHEYEAETFRVGASIEQALGGPAWHAFAGVSLARVDVDAYAGSQLAANSAAARAAGEPLAGTSAFTAAILQAGLVLDTRDHETFPTRGLFHDLVARAAPSVADGPAWGGITLTSRFYRALVGDRLVLAVRSLGDVLVGDAPLTELGRFGGLQAGEAFGAIGVRGITGGRFMGQTKALGTIELRAQLLPFHLFGERMNLGAAAFGDAGRVWTGALAPDAVRDDDGLGLHWGAGVGTRLRWGDSLLIRLDAAHSPNTSEVGGGEVAVYLTADSAF